MTTVLIADDQPMQRFGFRMLLESQDDMTVVGEAGNGLEALGLVQQHRPDVALMDIRMPLLDGIEATRRIVRTGARTRVLIVTTFDLDRYAYDGLRAGASGFLIKDALPEELLSGIRAVTACKRSSWPMTPTWWRRPRKAHNAEKPRATRARGFSTKGVRRRPTLPQGPPCST
ncbi:response regulator transcription factor, partial [Streptomyces sp. NPDC058357]|uniref:response regulator n=1 Tax=unclassified Streptomyces TaxID=2593676 RepID=UPI00365C9093